MLFSLDLLLFIFITFKKNHTVLIIKGSDSILKLFQMIRCFIVYSKFIICVVLFIHNKFPKHGFIDII